MKRWFKYIKPYLPAFILGPLCMIIEVVGEVVMPKLLSVIINTLTIILLKPKKSNENYVKSLQKVYKMVQ